MVLRKVELFASVVHRHRPAPVASSTRAKRVLKRGVNVENPAFVLQSPTQVSVLTVEKVRLVKPEARAHHKTSSHHLFDLERPRATRDKS